MSMEKEVDERIEAAIDMLGVVIEASPVDGDGDVRLKVTITFRGLAVGSDQVYLRVRT